MFVLAVIAYLGIPFLCSFPEAYPFVFRGWVLCEVYAVVTVLPVRRQPQVRSSIIDAIVVDMIDA